MRVFEHASKFMSLQDKTYQEIPRPEITGQVIKSSTADAARVQPRRCVPPDAQVATHRQLVKLVHVLLDETPALRQDVGEIADRLKTAMARLRLRATVTGYGTSGLIYRAIDSALFQRRHVVHSATPAWKKPWQDKQRAERTRRRRAAIR